MEMDGDTLAVYKFDEAKGTTLKDLAGNDHHGEIHKAQWVNVSAINHRYR